MDSSRVFCGFLDGTILSVDGGYRVLQHPRPERVFDRIADARWFLAINWCDQWPAPAGILNHEGKLSFQNQAALEIGETAFLPLEHRQSIFHCCLSLSPGESTVYEIKAGDGAEIRPGSDRPFPSRSKSLEILGVEIDPRYGKVAMIRTLE
jgi:hypothetical protein